MNSTEVIKNNLENDGFVYLPKFLKGSISLDKVLNSINKISQIRLKNINQDTPRQNLNNLNDILFSLLKIGEKNISFVNDAMNANQCLLNLFNDPKINNLVDRLLPSEDSFVCLNNHKFRIQSPGRDEVSNLPWHQDSHYNTMSSDNSSFALWISLSDIDEESGPVIFKKGSHKLGKLERLETKRTNDKKIYTIDDRYIGDENFPEISIPTKVGDIMLIHMNIIHTSGINKSRNFTKLSAQARFHQGANIDFLSKYN